jgi:hypothetical protein
MEKIRLNLLREALNIEYLNFKPIKSCKICFNLIPELKNGMRFHPEPYSFSPPTKINKNDLLCEIEKLTI